MYLSPLFIEITSFSAVVKFKSDDIDKSPTEVFNEIVASIPVLSVLPILVVGYEGTPRYKERFGLNNKSSTVFLK